MPAIASPVGAAAAPRVGAPKPVTGAITPGAVALPRPSAEPTPLNEPAPDNPNEVPVAPVNPKAAPPPPIPPPIRAPFSILFSTLPSPVIPL